MMKRRAMRKRSSPDDIRAAGWTVAIHNDYQQDCLPHTFWLFTMKANMFPGGDGWYVMGEGRTDAEALDVVREKLGCELPKENNSQSIPPITGEKSCQ